VASLSTGCSVAQKNDLLDRRRKLEARISAYEQQISVIMRLDDETLWSTEVGKDWELDLSQEDSLDNVLARYPDGWFTPERHSITFPSALAPGEVDHQSLQSIATIEAELWKGQVTDALQCAKHKDSVSARPSPLSSGACQIFSSRKMGISPKISNLKF
jgi:hypothetical protein